MDAKKNPKKDLSRNSGMYFVVGLTMVLMLTYIALEWKSFYGEEHYEISMNVQPELIEEIDLFKVEKPKPPTPPAAPEVIEIVEDDPEIEETVIQSTESDPEVEILKVNDIPDDEIIEDVDVDFIRVEEVPVFPGCENKKDKRACFNEKMAKHVRKNFRYPEIAQEMGIQGKVYIRFVIQKDGSIGSLQLRGPDKNLEKEAARIIDKLPTMTPGKQRGTPVRVPFNLPITFKLSN